MPTRRAVHIVLGVLVAIVVIGGAALGLDWYKSQFASDATLGDGTPIAGIGGPFTLTDTNGEKVSDTDFAGRPRAIFFGFTYCPDVCPTTLFELGTYLDELGPAAKDLAVIYITVDPERDTPEQMKLYLSSFNDQIIGLTGSQEELDPVLDAFRVYRKKVPLDDGDYTMDHTAAVYLFNRKGEMVGTIAYQEDKKTALPKLKRLLEKS